MPFIVPIKIHWDRNKPLIALCVLWGRCLHRISKHIGKHKNFIKLKLIIIKINGHFNLSNIDKFVFKKIF